MGKALFGFALLAGCVGAGCRTMPANQPVDPLVTALVEQASKKATPIPNTVDPLTALILQEIPLQTPLDQARAVMQRHGFSCWAAVPDPKGGICLHCTAWKARRGYYADRVIVKLFYERERKVTRIQVNVDQDVWHGF
jgi:hypothetical protein